MADSIYCLSSHLMYMRVMSVSKWGGAYLLIEAVKDRSCVRVVHGGALWLLRCLELRGHGGILQRQHPVQDLGHALRCA